MITLAVDTATKAASAAIIEDGEVRSEFLINHKTMHSRNLMPLVDAVVKIADIKKSDIDLFSTTIGPGSFTGVRIGVSAIKAMAYALKKPTVGINTLDCLAYDVYEYDKLICPVLDARNNQVYCAVYRRNKDDIERLTDYMGIRIEDLMKLIESLKNDCIFTGDAYKLCADSNIGDFKKYTVGNSSYMPKASVVGLMAEKRPLTDPVELLPFYLRKSQAERMMEKKHE